jgi:NADH:ubiquinone oxidoreductase subunit K
MVSLIWILLIIACLCLILKNNMLLFFIALELIVLAINLNFIFFSINNEDSQGFMLHYYC